MNKPFFIERSNENGTYTVVGRYWNFDEALEALKEMESDQVLSLWHNQWPETDFGYEPMVTKYPERRLKNEQG